MPSSIGHGLAAAAVTRALWPHNQPRRLVLTAVLSAVLLDVDAIGRPFGLGDLMFLGGHRALIHSLPFAALLGTTLVLAFYRRAEFNGMRPRIWIAIVLAVATHGVLDAFTTYGAGVMFFAPFSDARFKAPWLPFRGVLPEIVGIWVPALFFLAILRFRAMRPRSLMRPR